MATRLNIRFISILSVTVVAVAILLVGLWFLKAKGDATRNIKAADEYMQLAAEAEARGDKEVAQNHYERAVRTYGRAVHKEPANLTYLDYMEKALLNLRPDTRDEASEFDDMRIAIMATRARYRPQDADTHLALLEELFQIARFVRARNDRWQAVVDTADDMYARVLREDPKRVYAQLYRGLALTRIVNPRVDSEADIEEAEQALKQFLVAVPDHDLAWSALVANQLAVARLLEVDGKTRRAKAAYDEVDATIAQAQEAVPDGPEMARVLALGLVTAYLDDPGSVDREALAAAVDRMVELAGATEDPLLLSECVEILRGTDLPGRYARAITMLSNYLSGQPDRHYHRALLAELHYLNNDYEAAEMAVETLLAAEPVRVSRLSRFQHILKVRAQSLNADIEYRRWESAEPDQKEAQFAKAEEETNRLAAMVADPDTDPLLLRAEGKLAFAKRDYASAAQKFENALKLRREFETVWYAAHSLEQIGQVGLAVERLDQARQLASNSPQVLTALARLQAKMGRFEDANETIASILEIDPDYEPAKRLGVFIELRQADDTPVQDETAQAIADAQQAFENDELDTARGILLGVLEKMPNEVAVLTRLVGVEVRAGRTDEARVFLNRALSTQPNNRYLRALEASLTNDDPVEAMKLYVNEFYDDETDRAVYTAIQLRSMASQFDASARRYEAEGNTEAATDARARAERAREEVEPLLAAADQATPDHPALLEFFFTEAVGEGNWDRAEEIVVRAQRTDADQAGGLIFKGRLELAQFKFEAAVRTLTDATERKHFSSLAWRLLGRAHEQMGNFAEALRAYEEAYRCNPTDRYAIRWYVGLLHQTGEMVRALRVLKTARQAIPDDPTLRNQWLELESEVGNVSLTFRERRETYRANPEDTLNAMRLVALLSRAKPSREFVLDDAGKPRYEVDKWNLLPLKQREEALEKVAAEWAAECDQILQSLEDQGVKSLQFARLRAEVLRARGEAEAGAQALRSYADSCAGEEAVRAFIALATFESATDSVGAAAKTLEHARQFQTE
ncbi:MAG: tetratricopeptide repeat protein, partial [Planctomycetota bacterium]